MKNLVTALTTTALFSVLCFVAEAQQKGKALFPQAPGLQTYTYRESMAKNVPATLDTIRALGIHIVESSPTPSGITAQAYRKLLDERQLKCASIGVSYDELVKNPEAVAEKARTIGAEFVMTPWIPHEKPFTLDAAKKAVADFNKAGKILKEKGITFCYHTHGFEFEKREHGTLFDYMVKNTDPKFVSFEMDIMWVFYGGADPAGLLLKYPGRWKLMHLKDLRKGVKGDNTGNGAEENDVTLGTGQLSIPEILRAAKKVGVKYYFIEDESPIFREQVPQTINYLRGLTEN